MAGIYIHIPFCRSKCFYCGFYSVASARGREAYVQALCREMELREEYLVGGAGGAMMEGRGKKLSVGEERVVRGAPGRGRNMEGGMPVGEGEMRSVPFVGEEGGGRDGAEGGERKPVVETLYLGGGTPSYLEEGELEVIVDNVRKHWLLADVAECSIEMNPEDATPGKLAALRRLGFNRLTMGVQSFDDAVLKRINRTHTAAQAIRAVESAATAGFDNVGIDLIIGLPGSTSADIARDVEIIKSLDISHVSVYILSIDSNSVFERLSQKGKFRPQDDDALAGQYLAVSDALKAIGFEHYEISNFARDCKYSRHNTSYWQQVPYIGLGAAAHSYDGVSRQWNVAHLNRYIESLGNGVLLFEKEVLTREDLFNEHLMTNLRTMWGIDPVRLAGEYPDWWRVAERELAEGEARGLVCRAGNRLRLTERGWLVSDGIFRDLFVS